MSVNEHEFANAFDREFFQNGETGVPYIFTRSGASEDHRGPSITEDDFDAAGRLLRDQGVDIRMAVLMHGSDGAEARFKTQPAIPPEVLALIKEHSGLGQVSLAHIMH